MKAFKCPKCGGDVKYDIAKESILCEYCGETINRDDYQRFLDDNGLYATTQFTCPQCGGAVLSYDDTISTFCSYCGAPVVFDKRVVEDTKPAGIIPFSVSKNAANEIYSKKIKNAFFAPDWMDDAEGRKTVGIYMPYFVYGAHAGGHFTVKGEKRTNYGSYTQVNEYSVDFDLDAQYDGTRFDAARAFPDAMSESIDTYKTGKTVPFKTAYLAGYYADGGDVAEENYNWLVKELVCNDLRADGMTTSDGIKLKTGKIESHIEFETEKTLFPVWLHTHRRNGRVCYSAINGQTGDAAAEIPIDKWKYIKVSVIAAAIIAVIMNLFFTITPKTFLIVAEIILFLFGFMLRKLHGDVYVRENHMDDIGYTGIHKFRQRAKASGKASGSTKSSPGATAWSFEIPLSVRFAGWYKTLIGLAVFAAVLLSGTVLDVIYYAAAGISIALAVWSAFDIIKQQNLLASRDIPVFTLQRGGDGNG